MKKSFGDLPEIQEAMKKGYEIEQFTDPHEYKIITYIASGSFGSVYMAQDLTTNQIVAIKKVPKESLTVGRELRILQKIDNQCNQIIKLYAAFTNINFATKIPYVNYVFQYVPYDMGFWRNQQKRLLVSDTKRIFKDVLMGVQFLHAKNIVHRDIKVDNIMVDLNRHAFISDFGTAKELKEDSLNMPNIFVPEYRSPECFFGHYDTFLMQQDNFAIGCLFYFFITEENLFDFLPKKDNAGKEVPVNKVKEYVNKLGYPPENYFTSDNFPNIHQNHLENLKYYTKHIKREFSMKQKFHEILMKHQWQEEDIMNVYSLIKHLLKWDWKLRTCPTKALEFKFFQNIH